MTDDQFLSLVRAVLNIAGTWLIAYGSIKGLNQEIWTTISGAVLTLAGVGWGLFVHTHVSSVQAAAKVTGVEVVVGPTASPAMRKLAADPSVPGIVPKK